MAVIFAVAALAMLSAPTAPAQSTRRPKPEKGPRAVGLVELTPKGKAYLIPVVIMYDGQFYDASAYKASPVPMALDSGIVYEGERAGVSQGLFTVTAALQGPNNTWKAEGKWLPEGTKPANAPHKAETKPRDLEPDEGPPVLRRHETEKAKPSEPAPQSAPSSPPPSNPGPAASAPSPPAASAPPAVESAPPPVERDPNQPVLRRGKPGPAPPEPASPPAASAKPAPNARTSAATKSSAIQMIAAISDAGGPEPRPYTFSLKPAEEDQLRNKMLSMAAGEVRARAQQQALATVGVSAPASTSAQRRKPSPSSKPVQPQFDDVQLHVFDLSASNEPILVLMAQARMPQKANATAPDVQYILTLVARQDIYGDLHKAFSNITDTQHLDVLPRMDLIDAVDVDGDGRGELLFRKTSDTGSAFSVYRVIGDQLWPLFEGTPGT